VVTADSAAAAVAVLPGTGAPLAAPEKPGAAARLSVRAYPNPSFGGVRLRFSLPSTAHVSLRILDVTGRTVRVLTDADLPAGEHIEHWDGASSRGAPAPAGVYFVELAACGWRITEPVVALR